MNAHQLAETLELNYHTITYNLDVLIKNRFVVAEGPRYGLIYYPSRIFSSNAKTFKRIISLALSSPEQGGNGQSGSMI